MQSVDKSKGGGGVIGLSLLPVWTMAYVKRIFGPTSSLCLDKRIHRQSMMFSVKSKICVKVEIPVRVKKNV